MCVCGVPEGVRREDCKKRLQQPRGPSVQLYKVKNAMAAMAKSRRFAFNCKDGNRFVSTTKGEEGEPRGNKSIEIEME